MHQQRQDSVNGRSYLVYLTVTNMDNGKIHEVAELVLYRNDGNDIRTAMGMRDMFSTVLGTFGEDIFRQCEKVPRWVRVALDEIKDVYPNAIYCVNLQC